MKIPKTYSAEELADLTRDQLIALVVELSIEVVSCWESMMGKDL